MDNARLAKTKDGVVHLINPVGGAEYTMCGDAFNSFGMFEGDEDRSWAPVSHGNVDCPECIKVILACRGVRTSRQSA